MVLVNVFTSEGFHNVGCHPGASRVTAVRYLSAMPLLIDAHVHLHDCFDPAEFLDHSWRNFEQVGTEAATGVLMLTESAGVDWFVRLAGATVGAWKIEETADPCALVATQGSHRLVVIAGRQVVTREGLEVHLLGTRAMVPDGLPMPEVLAEGERLGALRLIPWGVGKWLFVRGRLLSSVIESGRPGEAFFLGDSSRRPFFWTTPRHFEEAKQRGVRVLSGTDPLPIPEEVSRAGSYGFRLESAADLTRPAEGIKAALRDPAAGIRPYGRLERLVPFLRHQIAMQRLKRRNQSREPSEIARR